MASNSIAAVHAVNRKGQSSLAPAKVLRYRRGQVPLGLDGKPIDVTNDDDDEAESEYDDINQEYDAKNQSSEHIDNDKSLCVLPKPGTRQLHFRADDETELKVEDKNALESVQKIEHNVLMKDPRLKRLYEQNTMVSRVFTDGVVLNSKSRENVPDTVRDFIDDSEQLEYEDGFEAEFHVTDAKSEQIQDNCNTNNEYESVVDVNIEESNEDTSDESEEKVIETPAPRSKPIYIPKCDTIP